MLSKAKIKLIRSLENKKERRATGLFLAEGGKIIEDMAPYLNCRLLAATGEWLALHPDIKAGETVAASKAEIERASLMQSPQDVVAVFEMPRYEYSPEKLKGKLVLALDGVQDPGNLGTIVRTADWFGIDTVLCSADCADIYNPKSIQATMGAAARVAVLYGDLQKMIIETGKPVFGTFLDGENIYETELANDAVIVMGNEGKGISTKTEAVVTRRITLPSFKGDGQGCVESLNVAAATAAICAEFRRRDYLRQ